MSDSDKVDVIIFGATAFTGKCVVREFISLNENKYSWAIAGRNENKLREVLEWASVKSGQDVTKIPIIICNCEDEPSLNKMAQRGRVVINCCGPYRLYGEPVVKACIENGTHHVDVSGEPEYMESIQLYYHEAAEKKGSYIISACAFESVCCDLGVIHIVNNFPGEVNSVESFLTFKGKSDVSESTFTYLKKRLYQKLYIFINELIFRKPQEILVLGKVPYTQSRTRKT